MDDEQILMRGGDEEDIRKYAEEGGANLTEEDVHREDCMNGKHHFVECDEWEPTCLYCGKFQ